MGVWGKRLAFDHCAIFTRAPARSVNQFALNVYGPFFTISILHARSWTLGLTIDQAYFSEPRASGELPGVCMPNGKFALSDEVFRTKREGSGAES